MTKPAASTPKKIWSWLKWPLALGLITTLVYLNRKQFSNLAKRDVRWELLAVAFVCLVGSVMIQFFRWYLLVKAQGFEFRYRDATRLGLLGLMFNYIAPGAVGGDVVKAILLATEQGSRRTVAVATILLDRILGFIALFAVGAFATTCVSTNFPHREKLVMILWAGAAGGMVGLMLLLHPSTPNSRWLALLGRIPKVGRFIQELADGISLYQTKRHIVLSCVGIGFFSHILIVSSFFACAHAIAGTESVPSFSVQMLVLPLAQVVGVVIPLPGGIGAFEGAVDVSYNLIGAPEGLGILAACAFRVISITIALFGSVYYFSVAKDLKRNLAATGQVAIEEADSTD